MLRARTRFYYMLLLLHGSIYDLCYTFERKLVGRSQMGGVNDRLNSPPAPRFIILLDNHFIINELSRNHVYKALCGCAKADTI